ncbi:uncharacterized protein B0T15DRAFT_190683 [Chaetomium strumarium]|uniref:Uncharacterized protein n=1 Tax=Chaetomium strumarium TaxID=1170767 RepID=A0AAJ0M151_9PEZI|nr:hypothetical protein B0T15DRAFT_190683 [Chaetomium strumarium]
MAAVEAEDDAIPTVPVVTLHPEATDSNGAGRWAIALTTVFTPPAGCVWPIIPDINRPATCNPPYFQHAGPQWLGYYSPGICPSGYTVGCIPDSSVETFNDERIKPGETVGVCVPVSYACPTDSDRLPLTSGVMAVSYYTTETTQTYSEARIVHIRWQSSDLSLFETPPLPGLTVSRTSTPPQSATGRSETETSTANTTTGQPGAVSSTAPAVPGSSSAALSSGAIAGIVTGVGLAAILGALVAFFVMRTRLKAARASSRVATDFRLGETAELEDTTMRVSPGITATRMTNGHTEGGAVELSGEPQPTRELPG